MAEPRTRRPPAGNGAVGDVLSTGENPVVAEAEAHGLQAVPCGIEVTRLRDNPNGPFIHVGNMWLTLAEASRLRIDLEATVDMATPRAALANPNKPETG